MGVSTGGEEVALGFPGCGSIGAVVVERLAMGAISYILFLGAMLGLALGLYFGLRTAKLI